MKFYDFVSSGASLSARLRSKKVSISRYLLFLYLWRKFTCRRRCENKVGGLPLFAQLGLHGPLRRAEGKGVKRSDHRERSSQSLPETIFQRVEDVQEQIFIVLITNRL